MADDPRGTNSRLRGGELAQKISKGMVQLMNEYTGRGPTKSRTYLHDNVVLCVLQDTLTKGELAMAAGGEREAVIEHRRIYQRLMREDATAMIEELTGRRVIAFLSDHHLDPDIAAESFILERHSGDRNEDDLEPPSD